MREYIIFDEFARAVTRGAVVGIRGRDAVIHDDTVIGQQTVDLPEIALKILQADMFEHANAGDAVKPAIDIPIVQQPYGDPV